MPGTRTILGSPIAKLFISGLTIASLVKGSQTDATTAVANTELPQDQQNSLSSYALIGRTLPVNVDNPANEHRDAPSETRQTDNQSHLNWIASLLFNRWTFGVGLFGYNALNWFINLYTPKQSTTAISQSVMPVRTHPSEIDSHESDTKPSPQSVTTQEATQTPASTAHDDSDWVDIDGDDVTRNDTSLKIRF